MTAACPFYPRLADITRVYGYTPYSPTILLDRITSPQRCISSLMKAAVTAADAARFDVERAKPLLHVRRLQDLDHCLGDLFLQLGLQLGGPTIRTRPTDRKSGRPASAAVGTSGNCRCPRLVGDRQHLHLAVAIERERSEMLPKKMSTRPPSMSLSTRVSPRSGAWIMLVPVMVMNMLAVRWGYCRCPGCHRPVARISLQVCDQLPDRITGRSLRTMTRFGTAPKP